MQFAVFAAILLSADPCVVNRVAAKQVVTKQVVAQKVVAEPVVKTFVDQHGTVTTVVANAVDVHPSYIYDPHAGASSQALAQSLKIIEQQQQFLQQTIATQQQLLSTLSVQGVAVPGAASAHPGKRVFETRCLSCHTAATATDKKPSLEGDLTAELKLACYGEVCEFTMPPDNPLSDQESRDLKAWLRGK